MKALKFTLEGKSAFFKKPDANTYLYFTYGHIHKVALLGIFGAILGYKGYNQMNNEDEYPEFYSKLQHIKVSIVPNTPNGIFEKKVNVYNNSVGYASKEVGGNLIIKEQWLEKVSWDIYVLLDCEAAKELSYAINNRNYIYLPYLGKNDHIADILNVKEVELVKAKDISNINSLFFKKSAELLSDLRNLEVSSILFKYEEKLPLKLTYEVNAYELETMVLTNYPVDVNCYEGIYSFKNLNLQFI